jgi:hypothetical protein
VARHDCGAEDAERSGDTVKNAFEQLNDRVVKHSEEIARAIIDAYDIGFKAGRDYEFNSTKTVQPLGMSAYLNKEDYENARYVKTPWGLLDRYAQLFVAT